MKIADSRKCPKYAIATQFRRVPKCRKNAAPMVSANSASVVTWAYAYDSLKRLTQAARGDGATTKTYSYDYDYNSNRTWRELGHEISGRPTTLDEYYTYDGLDRLTNMDRGQLTGTHPGYSAPDPPTAERDYTLDQLGNWTGYVRKTSGNTDLNQSRSHNAVNEIDTDDDHSNAPGESISASTGDNWFDPAHDAAGNMILAPQPGAESEDGGDDGVLLSLRYDACPEGIPLGEPPGAGGAGGGCREPGGPLAAGRDQRHECRGRRG